MPTSLFHSHKTSFLLQNIFGKWSSRLLAIAFLTSGQSLNIAGTYVGQYVTAKGISGFNLEQEEEKEESVDFGDVSEVKNREECDEQSETQRE
ncbi:unnamed protein product [Eruca vesicaria subsp. sativa]|uniref:Uncharacterized protein n=1 Tax=Eruca vesicaria subsp. sativa TaxID=29727 RepID=A0ABC8KNM8_ERUVS|nr:unnamed protein product [Eruca vesicaria subsp. sativa]